HVKSGTTCQGNEWGFSPGGKDVCPDCSQPSLLKAQMCGTAWPVVGKKGTCTACGGVDTSGGVEFGGCDLSLLKGGTKSQIKLNPSPNVLDDFEETFNTIMHENAHNYQLYLIKRYRENKTQLFKDIPYAKEIEAQIKMWDENAEGYVPGGPTYDKQPL